MQTERTTVGRRRHRASYDLDVVKAILDETFVCTVSYVSQGSARAIPTTYARLGDGLLLHGSTKAGWLSQLTEGAEVCVTVMIVNSIVLDSTMLHHSLNYRSVTLFGVPEVISEPQMKTDALVAVVDHVVPGRSKDLPLPSAADLRQTQVAVIPITEASAKIRAEGPAGHDLGSAWRGQIPVQVTYGPPLAQQSPEQSIPVPDYVEQYCRPGQTEGPTWT